MTSDSEEGGLDHLGLVGNCDPNHLISRVTSHDVLAPLIEYQNFCPLSNGVLTKASEYLYVSKSIHTACIISLGSCAINRQLHLCNSSGYNCARQLPNFENVLEQ